MFFFAYFNSIRYLLKFNINIMSVHFYKSFDFYGFKATDLDVPNASSAVEPCRKSNLLEEERC